MIETEKILKAKISSRVPRRDVHPIKRINEILSEICESLNIAIPHILFCDTLTRRVSSFEFRGIRYIVFDTALVESLFLFNKLILSSAIIDDVDKLYYKVFYQECLLQEATLALPCYQKYKTMDFTFDNQYNDESNEYVSYQLYFLLLHEVAHFELSGNKIRKDYIEFKKMMLQCLLRMITDYSTGSYIKEGLLHFFGVDADEAKDTPSVTVEIEKLDLFLEECFCDFQAFKFICNSYKKYNAAISASYSLIHYLINNEIIRNSFGEDSISMTTEADEPLFTAYLRLHLFTLIVYFNKCDIKEGILETCQKIDNRYSTVLRDATSLSRVPIDDNLKASLIKMSHEYMIEEE